mmetsp:Transcript_22474/g.62944  ORF Transcript_22474/g.62944 Transcript_22474/m.62944 type:complete len:556 (+) Transcript_22474:100-1767(+)
MTGFASEGTEKSDASRTEHAVPRKAQLVRSNGMLIDNLDATKKTLLDRTWFCAIMSLLSIANMLALGIEADLKCRSNCSGDENGIWALVDNVFTVIFIGDIVLALVILGPLTFFRGDRTSDTAQLPVDLFRIFDLLLVVLRAVDAWALSSAGAGADLKVWSAMRVMHLGRFAKQVQLIDGFRELWLILAGMADTIRTVMWVAVLLCLVIWVFAVTVTIAVNDGVTKYNYSNSFWKMDDYWGSVLASVCSLFQVLTRDKWSGSLVWPLVEANNAMIVFFIVFICVASLALLNTIIGAVVESTLRSARENQQKDTKEKQKNDTKTMASLEQIFREADTDNSGDLDEHELEAMMNNDKVKKAVNQLGIPMKDLELLFAMLDEYGNQKIKTDVFFRGCTRLRGPAMARDLQHVCVDLDRHVKTVGTHIRTLRNLNDSISNILDVIDTIETDIVKDPQDHRDPVLMARRGRKKESRSAYLRSNKTGESDVRSDGSSESEFSEPIYRNVPRYSVDRRRASVIRRGGSGGNCALRSAGNAPQPPASQPPPPPVPPHLRDLLP